MIKHTVNSIIEDENTNISLRDICIAIKYGNFMELRTKAYAEFWTQKHIIENINKTKAEENLDQNRSSKRLKSKLKISETNNTSRTIKNAAIDKYYNKHYRSLSYSEKNIISNGLNSILDLSDFSLDGQMKLFTNKEWTGLQQRYNTKIQLWKQLDCNVKKDLKLIEKMAVEDLKEA
ncbi:hypothetical protein BDB01DRAFT_852007 [Pilobolus umbonatus]|nr:hypothetical protein BDB01DRAFT_852007 [Pilobolus umbonatus]